MANAVIRSLWMAIWVTVVASAVVKNEFNLPGYQFFRQIPKPEQPDYLSFELSRGYASEVSAYDSRNAEEKIIIPKDLGIAEYLVEKFEALEVPPNFTNNLYNFVRTRFDLDQIGIRTLILTGEICFENGECIDLNDVGALCCPF